MEKKKYLLFVDDKQLGLLQGVLENFLDTAVRNQDKEMILVVTGLLNQVKNPREMRPRKDGWGAAILSQVFGK